MEKSPYERLVHDYEQGIIDYAFLRRAMKKIKAEQEQQEMKNRLTAEIIKATEMERKVIELADRAPDMKYNEARSFGFLAKAVVNMIVLEVKEDEKSLDLLERYMRGDLTGSEVEKIVRGE